MKPIQLSVSAFGPFAEKAVIPFAKLGEGGLFLVSGDTGAGKTTIFDAICFALFGEASGSNRTIDSVRSDFAQGDTKTYVELQFQHKGKEYRVLRNPAYRRPKKSGEGMTTETAEASLFCDGETLATGFVQVKKAVESLLSVDAKQFKQIAMIAQGEFLKLLYAESSERGAIFRKVFHTDLFAEFQLKLKEEEKQTRMHLEDCEKRFLYALNQLCPEEEFQGKEGIYQGEDVLQREKELFFAQQGELLRLKEEKNKLTMEIQVLAGEISRGEVNNKRILELEEAKRELHLLLEEREGNVEKQGLLLKQRIALDYLAPLDSALQREKSVLQEVVTQNESFAKELDILRPVLKELEAEQIKQELLQPQLNEEKIRLRRMENDFVAYSKKEELFKKKSLLWEEKEHLEAEIAKQQDSIAKLENSITEILARLEEKAALEKKQLVMQQATQTFTERKGRIEKILEMQKALKLEEAEVEVLRGKYKKNDALWREARRVREEVESAYLGEQAGILADSLQEGEACPVCGATSHPKKAKLSQSAPTEGEWKIAKKKEDTAYAELQELTAKGREYSGRCSLQKDTITKACDEEKIIEEDILIVLENIEKEEIELKQRARENQIQLKVLEKRGAQLNAERKQLETKKIEVAATQAALKKNAESGGVLQGELAALEERLEKNVTVEDAQNAIDALSRFIAKAEADYRRISMVFAEKKEEVQTLQTRLEEGKSLAQQGMKRVKAAEEAFLKTLEEKEFATETEYRQLRPNSREELEQEEGVLRHFFNSIGRLQEVLKRGAQNEETMETTDIQKLKATKNDMEVRIAEVDDRLEKSSGILATKERAIHLGEEELKQHKQLEENYLPVLELSKAANGELSGRDKITFESFVQGFYFDRVLRAANMRLGEMTDGRYALLRAETASDKRSQSGLEMEVLDHYTGKSRSVKSLSGGEAFKASLSLALGLSDVIQSHAGGVQIDAMFIDEGFGALDENSREQAVRVLQKLSYGSRLVGIISHITELKENIEKKIVVERSATGSTVQVLA